MRKRCGKKSSCGERTGVEGARGGPLILLNQHLLLDETSLPWQHIRVYKCVLPGKHGTLNSI